MSSTKIIDPVRRQLHERSLVYDAELDANGLASLWHADGSVQIGAMPRVTGQAAIREFFAGFFASGLFTKLAHELAVVWDLPEALIYEATAVYTRRDASMLRIPYTNIVRYRDGLFADYRVYIDTKPLLG